MFKFRARDKGKVVPVLN